MCRVWSIETFMAIVHLSRRSIALWSFPHFCARKSRRPVPVTQSHFPASTRLVSSFIFFCVNGDLMRFPLYSWVDDTTGCTLPFPSKQDCGSKECRSDSTTNSLLHVGGEVSRRPSFAGRRSCGLENYDRICTLKGSCLEHQEAGYPVESGNP